ncbi:hypothetical protein EON64_02225 [archaeon]|nr:MAG: hypothetical protein EON64_02225 [archaeon]
MDSPPATPVEPPQQCDDSVQPPNPPEEHLQTVGFCAPCEPVEHAAPVNRLVLPSDVAEFTEEDESIYIIGTREGKVTKIAGLEDMKNLKVRLEIVAMFYMVVWLAQTAFSQIPLIPIYLLDADAGAAVVPGVAHGGIGDLPGA